MERQIIIRIGDPYMMKDKYRQPPTKAITVNSDSAYFLGKEDLAFSGIVIACGALGNKRRWLSKHSRFEEGESPEWDFGPEEIYDYIHRFSWRLVEGMAASIYIRDAEIAEGTKQEKWREISPEELKALDAFASEDMSGHSVHISDAAQELSSRYKKIRRDSILGGLGI
jgi:hypothetical protein